HVRRPRQVPGGGRLRLPGQTGEHRPSPVGAASVAPSLATATGMGDDDKVGILLVDDQPSQLLSPAVILRELGERLVTARSGREALQKLMDEDFAVILLDVNMPDTDGFVTAGVIPQHPRFVGSPILFFTP